MYLREPLSANTDTAAQARAHGHKGTGTALRRSPKLEPAPPTTVRGGEQAVVRDRAISIMAPHDETKRSGVQRGRGQTKRGEVRRGGSSRVAPGPSGLRQQQGT